MQNIMDAVERVCEFLQKIPLSKRTILQYQATYQNIIIPYCAENQINLFCDAKMKSYVDAQIEKAKSGEIAESTMRLRRRSAALLADCMQDRELSQWLRRSIT